MERRGSGWNISAPSSPVEYSDWRGSLTKGAEMLVSKKKDMLYHDTIDDCFDVDAYWNRKEEEPICF